MFPDPSGSLSNLIIHHSCKVKSNNDSFHETQTSSTIINISANITRPLSIMLKICLKCFWEFPKNFPYYANVVNVNVAITIYIQWNLCIMDTLGPTKGVQIIKVS